VDEAEHRRAIPLERATTLPASWYAGDDHHELELERIFRHGWSCVGVTDDVVTPGSYHATTVAGAVPIVLTRDFEGRLRGFLNVCRHRGAPVAQGTGGARLLQCPYHAWIYRLDGSLARAGGMEGAEDFSTDEFGLTEIAVATWARFVFVCPMPVPAVAAFDAGPLARAIEPYALEGFELAIREHAIRNFNWKVMIENYSENFHTPWIHPELIVNGWDYPIVTEGPISLAWDRPLHPRNSVEETLAQSLPTDAAWASVAGTQVDDVFIGGLYFTLFPNLLVSSFSRYVSAFWLTPVGPRSTRVDYVRLWHPDVDDDRRKADHEASTRVGDQDLDICEAVQRGYNAGIDTRGRLSPVHERGVAHVHRLLAQALHQN
jgi:phenylpropionate dioxygenase-like ring-hydroxylating dioxygenase large terminal subunit